MSTGDIKKEDQMLNLSTQEFADLNQQLTDKDNLIKELISALEVSKSLLKTWPVVGYYDFPEKIDALISKASKQP